MDMTDTGHNNPNNIPWQEWVLIIAMLLVCALLLTSCKTHRQLITSDSRDSVRVETVIRTEYVRDTVEVEIPVERTMQIAEDSSHLETVYAVSDAFLRADGRLYHTLENKAGKRPVEVKKEVVYRDSIVYRDRVVTKTEVKEVPHELTWWQKAQMKGFWLLFALLAVVFRKRILSVVKLFTSAKKGD